MPCTGTADTHCCGLGTAGVEPDGRCPFVVDHGGLPSRWYTDETGAKRRWVCSLRRDLGSWEAVHMSDPYQSVVRPYWDSLEGDGTRFPDCGYWEGKCAACAQGTPVGLGGD